MAKRWYVAQAYSGYEKRAVQQLQEAIELNGLSDFFGEIIVPTEEVVEMKAGQKRKSERKFFPGYVLINMEMNDDTWYLVKNSPRIIGFVGGRADKPTPISQREADAIMQRLEDSAERPAPRRMFDPGEVVRVTDGPFADFNGVVEEVDYDKNRLRVAVLIFGRSTPVELEFSQVEKT